TKEHEIRAALAAVMKGRTTIVIAHRPATVALADRVVLLDRGRIVAEGTHTELLATSERYRRLLAQSAREEAGSTTPQQAHDALVLNLAVVGYLVAAAVAVVLGRTQITLITRVGESFLRDLRVRVFDHLQAMGMTFFDSQPAGRLVSRMTSDVDALQTLVQQGLVMFIQNALLFVATIIVLVVLSPV